MDSLSPQSLRPPLKWVGGKRWFIERYIKILAAFKGYRIVEPFSGGLALSFGLNARQVLAGDLNPHLINFYKQLQSPNFAIDPVKRSRELYYQLRQEFNSIIISENYNTLRAAQLFWLLNRMGFNGLCRFNQEGLYNTPFGDYASEIQFPLWERYRILFEGWTFQATSFENIAPSSADFIFCDPPYDNGWQGYYESNFSFDKQKSVVDWLKQHNGPGLIMNHATPSILELYQAAGFECHIISAPRSVSAKAASRKNAQEVIATHHFSWKDLVRSV